jgi:hypothetical protein
MSSTNSVAAGVGHPSGEEVKPAGFRGPPVIGPSGKSGGYIADDDADRSVIRQWLEHYRRDATAFSSDQADDFIQLIQDGCFSWIVLLSGDHALTMPWFDQLFRAAIETDTHIWSASDDTEFGMHLFCSMIENWEFLAPYIPESTESTSLTSLRDGLARIEARIRPRTQSNGNDRLKVLPAEMSQLANNGLHIDLTQGTIGYRGSSWFLGNTIVLRLAERLGRCPAKWFSFDELRGDVWCDLGTDDATIGRTIRLLRSKLRKENITGITIDNPRSMKRHARLILS